VILGPAIFTDKTGPTARLMPILRDDAGTSGY